MTDIAFLQGIRDRLVHVHGDAPNADFIFKLEKIIESMGGKQLPMGNCEPGLRQLCVNIEGVRK